MPSNTRILVGEDEWEPYGDTGSTRDQEAFHLKSGLTIAGCPMHVTAIPVRYTGEEGLEPGIQEGVPGWEDEFKGLTMIDDTAFQTVTIQGREFVLVATPYEA